MATQISNVLTPAQTALNSAIYGNSSASTPATTGAQTSGNVGFFRNLGFGTATQPSFSGTYSSPVSNTPAPAPVAPATPSLSSSPFGSVAGAPTGVGSGAINPQNSTSGAGSGVVNSSLSTGGAGTAPVTPVTPVTSAPATAQPSPLSTITNNLTNVAGGNAAIGQEAANIRNQYSGLIAQTGILGQGLAENDQTGGGTTAVGQGLANLAYNSASGRASALAADEQNQLASLTPELTAQNQNAQALGAAGQLSTPSSTTQQVGQGTTVLGANGQPVATTPVVGAVGSQTQYPVAATTYDANGNPTTASGGTPASGNTSSPFTAGQVAGEASQGEQYVQNNATIGAAQQVQQKINTDITQNGLNPSSANVLNAALQWANGQNLSSTPYANLANDLNDYAGTIGPIIGALGIQTDAKSFMAQQMTDGQAQGQTLMQVLQNLNDLMVSKNAAVASAGQGGTGAGQTNANTNVSTSGSVTAGGYGYTKDPTTGLWTATQ